MNRLPSLLEGWGRGWGGWLSLLPNFQKGAGGLAGSQFLEGALLGGGGGGGGGGREKKIIKKCFSVTIKGFKLGKF